MEPVIEPEPQTYTFYAVADNKDLSKARWYRTYSAQRSSGWKKTLEDAKIWSKRSSAKSKATSLGPSALIVEFVVTTVNVIDNSEHIKKAAERRRRRVEAVHKQEVEYAQFQLERAQERLRKLQEKK